MSDLPTVHFNAMLQAQAQMKPTTMANGSDSAILYKSGERSTRVHAVDVDAWLNLGWSREPVPVVEVESVESTVPPIVPPLEPESPLQPEAEADQSLVEETSTEEVVTPEAIVPARRKRAVDAIA